MSKANSPNHKTIAASDLHAVSLPADEYGPPGRVHALSPRQQSALPVVALSPSLAQAAQAAGVGRSTLNRWMNEPAFRSEIVRVRQEAAELARQEMQGMMLRAASVINNALDDADPAIRLRAARYALTFANASTQIHHLNAQLDELLASLHASQ